MKQQLFYWRYILGLDDHNAEAGLKATTPEMSKQRKHQHHDGDYTVL